jgi:fructosamine-3-kinase
MSIPKKYLDRILVLKKQFDFLAEENFVRAQSGTRFFVLLSENYVLRFRDDDPSLLVREAELLGKLENPLIPEVVWSGKVLEEAVMIERRLPGEPLDTLWSKLSLKEKDRVVEDIYQFLLWLKTQGSNKVSSVNTGLIYSDFYSFLIENLETKIKDISVYPESHDMVVAIREILTDKSSLKKNFTTESILVHGDLIIHNLLFHEGKLSGVLDWEFSLYGDTDYDISRIYYYHECAKAYWETGEDETYEADFTQMLISKINEGLSDTAIFEFDKKYKVMRAFFYLNALFWASHSLDPVKNIEELSNKWFSSPAK